MKIINLSKKQLVNSGRFGLYFRLSLRTGVKILKNAGYKEIPDVNSLRNQKIIQEATIGVLADAPTKRLAFVKFEGKYYIGILQRHVASRGSSKSADVLKLKKELAKKEVVHGDLQTPKNIINSRNGFVVIDFDPDRAYYVGAKSTYYTVKNKLIKDLKKSLTL